MYCKIAAGEIPSPRVYEDELIYAIRDINPQAPVHFLVIPREHITGVDGINKSNSALVARCFEVIPKIAEQEGLKSGYRVISNCGPDAGQTVPHLHFHVIGGKHLNDSMA